MRNLIYSGLLILCFTKGLCQSLHLGVTIGANNTFLHKGKSIYNDENHGTGIAPGIVAGIDANIGLNYSWHL